MSEPDPVGSKNPPAGLPAGPPDSPPVNAERRTESAVRYDRFVAAFARPFARAVAAYAAPCRPSSVIDHGAGTGVLTRLVHARSPNTMIYAVDPSIEMLSGLCGEPRCVSLNGVASDLDRLVPGLQVSAVASSLVLMFCEDPSQDLSLLRARTISEGRLAASVLGQAEGVEPFWCYWSAVGRVIPDAWSPERYPHHRFADPQTLVSAAQSAGWRSVAIAPVAGRRRLSARFAWDWLNGALPIGVGAGYATPPDETMQRVRSEFLSSWGASRTVVSRGWMVRARNPG